MSLHLAFYLLCLIMDALRLRLYGPNTPAERKRELTSYFTVTRPSGCGSWEVENGELGNGVSAPDV